MKPLTVFLISPLTALLISSSPFASTSPGQEAAQQQPNAPQDKATDKPAPAKPAQENAVPEKVVPEKQAVEQLTGGYRIVSGESSGKQILPERLGDITVRITAKTITTYDGDRQQRFNATYRIDTQHRPWRIRMVSAGASGSGKDVKDAANTAGTTADGLIELTEQGAKLIYALPSGETPRSFKTGNLQQLFVLERLKEPGEKEKGNGSGNGNDPVPQAPKPTK